MFLLPMERDLGLSRSVLSFSVSLGLLVFGLAAPLSGRLMDAFGPRRVATAGLILVALSFGLSTLAHSAISAAPDLGRAERPRHRAGRQCAGRGGGERRWFVRQRGLVTGLFGAATSAGQLMFIPLLTAWAARLGWTGGVWLIAGVALALVLPVWLPAARHSATESGPATRR